MLNKDKKIILGVQGWRSGEKEQSPPTNVARIRCHKWVEFVGSLLCTERFSPGTPVFPFAQKPTFEVICVNC